MANCLARSAGAKNGMLSTATPRRTWVVLAATYDSAVIGSKTLRYASPQLPSGGDKSRCIVHKDR
ncbi:hypothetical protein GCM10010484_30420 [Actinokineospora globicatena]